MIPDASDPVVGARDLKADLFVAALLRGASVEHAGDAANIGRATAYRWLTRPDIVERLRVARVAALEASVRAAAGRAEDAVRVMVDLLHNAKSEGVRLRAAEALLGYATAAGYDAQTEETLRALETQVQALTTGARA